VQKLAATEKYPSQTTAPEIVGLFPELLGFGGIQEASRQIVHALQNILARRNFSGAYLGLNDPRGQQTLPHDAGSALFQGFQRSKGRFVLRALLLARKKPRIVIAAHPNLAVPALWMKKFAPATKTIALCHGVEVWEILPARRRAALLAADIVVAPSSYTAGKLNRVQGVAAEKIRMLPWPINTEMLRMSEDPSGLSLPAGFPAGRVILTVGRWAASERYKGADDLIRAMPQLLPSFPGLHLVAVGSGDDVPRLRAIAAELRVAESVHFFKGISRDQLAACYAHSEIFALPSTGEGFGIVFIEAMAFGQPVLGAAAGGVTDIVEDGVNGILIPPNEPSALPRSLDRLLSDSSLRSALGHRGAETVREKYRFPALENNLERILLECGLDSSPVA
jgi:phosphatidylinositol alpha-1,6-mannosyltransferase